MSDETNIRSFVSVLSSPPKDRSSHFFDYYDKYDESSSSAMDITSFLAFSGAKAYFQVKDMHQWNIMFAVGLRAGTSNVTKLVPFAWDADRLLGVQHDDQGKRIVDTVGPNNYGMLGILDRSFYFRHDDVVRSAHYDGPPEYEGRVEREVYSNVMTAALNDQTLLALPTLLAATNKLRHVLKDAADRDADKWSRWYFEKRLEFDEAVDELEYLLTVRHTQFLYELNDSDTGPYPFKDAMYSDKYYEDEYGWDSVRPNDGMLALLYIVLLINVLSFLIPDAKYSALSSKAGWLSALTGVTDVSELNGMSATAVLKLYMQTWTRRIYEWGYFADVLIWVVMLAVYYISIDYDFTDDSEILGHHYMASIRFIWLYFAIVLNLCFQLPDNKFRVLSWLCIVLATNIYSIIDLFEFSQVTNTGDAVNSRGNAYVVTCLNLFVLLRNICNLLLMYTMLHYFLGVAVSLDSDIIDTFYLYVIPRLFCQLVVFRYSIEIASVSRQLTKSIDDCDKVTEDGDDKNDGECSAIDGEKGAIEMRALYEGVLGSDAVYDSANADSAQERSQKEGDNNDHKRKMKLFMHLNMGIFMLICVGFIIYISVSDLAHDINVMELFFSVLISVAILVNIRAFYSCIKWFWLHAYGFSTEQLDIIFGNREDSAKWSLETFKNLKPVPRDSFFFFLLPGVHLSTEKKMRTVDGWTKKISHTYDGMLVFVLSAQSFSSSEDAIKTYSLAYLISLLYMILYVVSYRQNGTLGWIIYGAKARIMDGYLGKWLFLFVLYPKYSCN